MSSVTADTNVYVSALQFGGVPRTLLDLARAGAVRLDISDAIMAEVLRVLKDKFDYPPQVLQATEASLASITNRVRPARALDIVQTDPSDNRILECATEARSDYLVTGDRRHLLPLGRVEGIPIVTPADFMQRFRHISQDR